jgi:hypothetical protein
MGNMVAIRHVFTPTVSFSYAPDFSTSHYGYYQTYQKTDASGNVSVVEYSPYSTVPCMVYLERERQEVSR